MTGIKSRECRSAQVFLLNLQDFDDAVYKKFYRAVSLQRRRVANRYCRSEDAVRCVMSEILVRYVYRQLRTDEKLPEFVYPSRGKPYLQDVAGFYFNISHTGTFVAVGYAESEIGIDLEQIDRSLDRKSIAAFMFTPEEQAYVFESAGDEEQKIRFTEVWTAKESYLKYLGTGFKKNPLSFSVDVRNKMIAEKENGLVPELAICGSHVCEDYYLTVCGNFADVSYTFPSCHFIMDAILQEK